jgi:hypothetical protein
VGHGQHGADRLALLVFFWRRRYLDRNSLR